MSWPTRVWRFSTIPQRRLLLDLVYTYLAALSLFRKTATPCAGLHVPGEFLFFYNSARRLPFEVIYTYLAPLSLFRKTATP